ncbi:glutamate-rich WD repeat-containing protein 1 [Planococcus citri]|uniref:glutamate-rich WD repeat-containing protein 1 n=1 Tax=Planococcus citri TaxID=170843 RepID=UPI0031F99165
MDNENEIESMEVSESDERDDDSIDEETEDTIEEDAVETNDGEPPKRKVYLPGQSLRSDEVLEHDPSAYVMLHEADAGTPCLSFDIIPDNLGSARETFPHSCYVVAGTQAAKRNQNNIIVMKMSNLRKTQKEKENEDDSSDESSSDEETDADGISSKSPVMNSSPIAHFGCINRIRSSVFNNTVLAAVWSELGRVTIWDLKTHLNAVENRTTVKVRSVKKKNQKKPVKNEESEKPLYTFTGHLQEGYAIDWSSTVQGVLATGDCSSNIHIWSPRESTWHVDQRPFKSHNKSVEDIQWSPQEKNVLASCSVDKTIKIWDIRAVPSKACMLTAEDAHSSDVNVISWNRTEPLIVSGGDDGYVRVWDLRQFKKDNAVATFKHHTEPVTTVEWHPTDSSVFASGGEDNQIALWDLAVERDSELNEEEIKEIPPQLLFIHLGQQSIKELHWHRQIPGVIISTAETGFNVFKTISV